MSESDSTHASASLDIVANARMPSQRAQSLQVAQTAAAFARVGIDVTLWYAQRRDTPALPLGIDLWSYYGVGAGARPEAQAVPCLDWIDVVPRRLQFLPARMQELSFASGAANRIQRAGPERWTLSRELETASSLARKGRANVFLELHRMPGGRLRRYWLMRALERLSGIIAISGGVREDLLAFGARPDQVLVAHDGFEVNRFASLPTRSAARELLDLPQDRPLVVYTGGLLEWKGVDLLVAAARSLPEVQFAIAGGMDADVAMLRSLASGLGNVRIDGFQAPERVALYLAAGDLGVVPNRSQPAISSRYTSPLKVFEAMAVGLPLVVSDLPSMRDILSDEEAVFVAPDNADSLARGISELLANEVGRAERARLMRERAPRHSWDARAKLILDWMGERAR
ncbi:MAG: glycosyltransferase involved in cell wall biosynthesis [Planctomycetota bacterium]|jgi:glycosyltransferase involved in cell wall biosynthesis